MYVYLLNMYIYIYIYGECTHANCFAVHLYGTAYATYLGGAPARTAASLKIARGCHRCCRAAVVPTCHFPRQ